MVLTTIIFMIFGYWLLRHWVCRRELPEPQAEPERTAPSRTVMTREDTQTLKKMVEEVMILREHTRGLEVELMKSRTC